LDIKKKERKNRNVNEINGISDFSGKGTRKEIVQKKILKDRGELHRGAEKKENDFKGTRNKLERQGRGHLNKRGEHGAEKESKR